MPRSFLQYSLLLCFGLFCFGCSPNTNNQWSTSIPVIGTFSSPRATDLNSDGIKDIVLGVGKNEFQAYKYGVLALDGNSGDTLWTFPCRDQMYGSAVFLDVTGDGVNDVFITGRSYQLYALEGQSGQLLWQYQLQSGKYDPLGLTRFNFYNPILVKDYSGDELEDLLVVNGGNVRAAAGDSSKRYPGTLLLMNSSNGSIIALDSMPDGRESYMTPVYYDFDQDGTSEIIFATGGETISGAMYLTNENSFMAGGLVDSRKLIEHDNGHGFVASPVVADLNGDGYLDLIALDHGGIVTALNGRDFSLLWERRFEDLELNAQASPGYFNRDDIPDLFINGARGKWPENSGSHQFFLDGKTGQILKEFSVGCAGFASAVSLDLEQDGKEEVLLPVNEYDCRSNNSLKVSTWLQLFSLDTTYQFTEAVLKSKNISSTPWIGDLDGDTYTDLVFLNNKNVRVIYEFLGLELRRTELKMEWEENSYWNQFLGPWANNIYQKQNGN